MTYSIEYSTAALVVLQALPSDAAAPLFEGIERLAIDPRPKGARVVKGSDGRLLRVRVGSYRVAYEVRQNRLIILILKVGAAK